MIETVKRPYEFLVRWREGIISGAHVGFELTTTEGGEALSTTALPVMPVDIGQGIGFPLADILAQLQIGSIIAMDVAKAELVIEKKTVAEKTAEVKVLTERITVLEKGNVPVVDVL